MLDRKLLLIIEDDGGGPVDSLIERIARALRSLDGTEFNIDVFDLGDEEMADPGTAALAYSLRKLSVDSDSGITRKRGGEIMRQAANALDALGGSSASAAPGSSDAVRPELAPSSLVPQPPTLTAEEWDKIIHLLDEDLNYLKQYDKGWQEIAAIQRKAETWRKHAPSAEET